MRDIVGVSFRSGKMQKSYILHPGRMGFGRAQNHTLVTTLWLMANMCYSIVKSQAKTDHFETLFFNRTASTKTKNFLLTFSISAFVSRLDQ